MSKEVTVQPFAVLYAIRYGLGRQTGAFEDALTLIRQNADMLREQGWMRSVLDDLALVARADRYGSGLAAHYLAEFSSVSGAVGDHP